MCTKNRKYVLHIHNVNPYISVSGSESFIIQQVNYFKMKNIDSLIIFPINRKFLFLKLKAWGIIYNHKLIEINDFENIAFFLEQYNQKNECLGVYIHSFLRMNVLELIEILSFRKNINIYLHDYCSCCYQYNLLKNDIQFCGNAKLYDEKCNDCKYYEVGKVNKADLFKLMYSDKCISIISPSEYVKKVWMEAYPEIKDVFVVPHNQYSGSYDENRTKIVYNEPIKVAFVGSGAFHKGWEEWIKAVEKAHEKGLNYEFYHLGNVSEERNFIKHIAVSVKKDGPEAMINALRENKIHVAVLFSVWPETYSYTYYESLAAGSYVITNNISGNIQDQVRKNKNGIVIVPNSDALFNLLNEYDVLMDKINDYRLSEHYNPLHLLANDEYVKFLKSEKNQLQGRIKKRRKFGIILTSMLYRIWYWKFV